MIDIINRQRRHRINTKHWRAFTTAALKAIKRDQQDVSIVFASDPIIRKLNAKFRDKDYATDVLSFPSEPEPFEQANHPHLGEVVISVQRAAAQAKENGLTLRNEIEQLILHGLLHLCGYDHQTDNGEMNRLELKLRKKLKI